MVYDFEDSCDQCSCHSAGRVQAVGDLVAGEFGKSLGLSDTKTLAPQGIQPVREAPDHMRSVAQV